MPKDKLTLAELRGARIKLLHLTQGTPVWYSIEDITNGGVWVTHASGTREFIEERNLGKYWKLA